MKIVLAFVIALGTSTAIMYGFWRARHTRVMKRAISIWILIVPLIFLGIGSWILAVDPSWVWRGMAIFEIVIGLLTLHIHDSNTNN